MLSELDKYYKKESRIQKLSKLKEFCRGRKETEERLEEYIRRYEKVARELKMLEGES